MTAACVGMFKFLLRLPIPILRSAGARSEVVRSMDMFDYLGGGLADLAGNLELGFSVALSLKNLGLCFLGCLIGTLIGVLPGVGPDRHHHHAAADHLRHRSVGALIMLAGIYYGAQYGGSTTAILVNIPGEATSVVTTLDGHQMAKQGRAGVALGIAAIGSFIRRQRGDDHHRRAGDAADRPWRCCSAPPTTSR